MLPWIKPLQTALRYSVRFAGGLLPRYNLVVYLNQPAVAHTHTPSVPKSPSPPVPAQCNLLQALRSTVILARRSGGNNLRSYPCCHFSLANQFRPF
jgi:hypothetical protein